MKPVDGAKMASLRRSDDWILHACIGVCWGQYAAGCSGKIVL